MKAFICVLLVASVASQQFDGIFERGLVNSRFGKDSLYKKSLFGRGGDFLEKDVLPFYPSTFEGTTYGEQMNLENMLTFNEIVRTSLFREYFAIPLFREYFEKYPVVFQKYVESPLFQKFWTIPAFQQYFRNPVFFYKYIVPQLTLVKENMMTSTFGGLRTESILEQIFNKDYYGNNEWTTPFVTKKFTNNFYPYTSMKNIFGDNEVNYKFLLEKMMAKLYNEEKMNVLPREIATEVRAFPYGQVKEQTVGRFVDPITGEQKITYGDLKVVDEKMIPSVMDFPMEKETLLKKYFLNKIFGGEKKMFMTPQEEVMTSVYPEMYKYNKYNPIVDRIYSGVESNKFFAPRFTNKMDLIKDELIKEKMIKDELINGQYVTKGDFVRGDLIKDTTFLPLEKKMDLLRKMELMGKGGLIGGEEKLINSLPIEKQMELINYMSAPTTNTFGRVPLTRDTIITKDALKMKALEKELIKDAIKA